MQDAAGVKTGRLYEEDAYAVHFDAAVVSAEGNDVVLDRTLFFPEEGGQVPDRGTLAGFPVTDVQIRGDEIHHTLDLNGAPDTGLRAGDRTEGDIDWAFRFSNMQQHSGEHLFSGLVHRMFGFDNVGFHLSEREVTLDFNGVIPPDRLEELEILVNRAVTADVPSVIRYYESSDPEAGEYRSKLDLPGMVRIVEFPGYDRCACCAPHVRRTGEIGLLIVTGMIRYKKGVRVSILCGERALKECRRDRNIVLQTAQYLTTSPDEIYAQTVRAREEIRTLKGRVKELAGEKMLRAAAGADPDAEHVILFSEDADDAAARSAVNMLTASHRGYCGVFTGSDEDGYRFVIGAGSGADAKEAAELLRGRFGARGGGSPRMVQGSVKAAADDLRALFSPGGV